MPKSRHRTIDLWIMLHTPEKAHKRLREISVSIHSDEIFDESRPTKISGSNSIELQGYDDIYLVHLDMNLEVPLFIHVVVVIDQTGALEKEISSHRYIGCRNMKLEPGFLGKEILLDVPEFQLYNLCHSELAADTAA